tara:strand:+ start:582 stop:812 length:231 start_codon:yes stop_codon:yes gene_type:complete
MGRMKDKAIKEQELQALDSLYDAKYWEVKDIEYEFYMNSREYFYDLDADADEENFIKNYVKQNKSTNIKQTKKCVE